MSFERAKKHGQRAIGGLTVGAVIWAYATFADKDDVTALQRENGRQWRAISQLQAKIGVPVTTTNKSNYERSD